MALFRKLRQRWNTRNDEKQRQRRAATLAGEALRCLKLGDQKPFAPKTMREWLT